MDGPFSPRDHGNPTLSRSASPSTSTRRRRDARDALAEMNTANECLLFLVSAMFGADTPCERPGGPCPKIGDVITFLRRRFAGEEERMQDVGYPHHAKHVAEHRAVLARLEAMHRHFRCGRYDPKIVLDFLETWAIDHIEHFDKPLGHFLVGADIGDLPDSPVSH